MKLSALISSIDQLKNNSQDLPAVEITGIQFDSREVRPGDLFVAQEGASFDGHAYIDVAIKNGAVAVVGRKALDLGSVPYLQVENTREMLAYLSAAFHEFPARRLTMIGGDRHGWQNYYCQPDLQHFAGLRDSRRDDLNC